MINYSVIIPYYNSSKSVKTLLNSIPEREDIQVIVVDDFSEKNEVIKAEKYLAERNYGEKIFIKNQEHANAGKCRNQGLEEAKGKWLIFADADDFFLDGFITILDKYKQRKDLDIIFFKVASKNIEEYKKSGRHTQWNLYVDEYLEKKSNRVKYLHAVPWGKMILKSIVQDNEITFDEIKVANDVMFSVKLGIGSNNIEVDQNIIYCVTESSNSLTTKKNKEQLFLRLSVWIDRYVLLKNNLQKKDFYELNLSAFPVVKTIFKELGLLSFLEALFLVRKKKVLLISKKRIRQFIHMRNMCTRKY